MPAGPLALAATGSHEEGLMTQVLPQAQLLICVSLKDQAFSQVKTRVIS